MTRSLIIALPFAFLFGACDTPEATPNDDAIEVADDTPEAGGERRGRGHGNKFAKLDVDGDGTISQAEAQAHPRFADRFAELDADKDGKLTQDEVAAMKGHHGKRGKHGDGGWHDKSPAERAAHKLEKYDRNGDKVLTPDEVQGHRFADKFAEIDADRDGKLTLDEITTFKAAHHGDRGGPPEGKGWRKDGHPHEGKEWHGKRGDHDDRGWHGKTPEERADKIFARFDANADSVISRDEVKGPFADKFDAADADKDGKLTRAELAAFTPAKRADAPAVR